MAFEAGYNKFKKTLVNQRINYTEYKLINGGSESTNWYYIIVIDNQYNFFTGGKRMKGIIQ
ncbi:MAG TPA: hypothetical protein PKD83_04165 [Ignavibacteria bacterium]|nr:hypothetical protein [Ignavibacteria bacterium]